MTSNKVLKSLAVEIIRYQNDEVLNKLDAVLKDWYQRMIEDSTSPTPPYKGGESIRSHRLYKGIDGTNL